MGIIYTNRFRNYNIMEKDDDYQIITSNPCFTGDTLILTDKGYFEIQDLVGQKVNVWNGYEYSEVEPRVTGENQELMKITFSNGMSVKCTPYHKFILDNQPRTEAKDLKHGMKLADFDYPVLGTTEDIERNFKAFRGIMACSSTFEDGNLIIKNKDVLELQLAISLLNIKSTVMDDCLIVPKNELAKLNKYWHITDTVYDKDVKFDIYIDKVEKLDYKADKVYCFTEYKNHSGIFNGILAAQCGEQPLAEDSACNLGSINISEFVVDPYTEKASFDMEDFKHAVKVSIVALDEVLNEGMKLHALEGQRRMAHDYRNIGLGVMGIADMLVKLGITYGSKEAIDLLDKIGYEMFRTAVFTSNGLAKIYGTYPKYKDVVFDSEIMKNHFSEDELKELRKHGLRNNSLLSVAPTGLN